MKTLKQEIVGACQEMDRRQFVANHDGNISVRVEEDRFLVTPTSFAKRSVREEDLLLIDFEGKVIEGSHRVFSEWRFHRAIYELSSEITSICHSHPPYATAWGLTGRQIEFSAIPEAIVSLGGPIVTTEFLTPSASHAEIKAAFMPAIQNCYAFLSARNGVFTVGDSPEMAYLRTELVEQVFRAHTLALEMGSVKALSHDVIRELCAKRPPLKPAWKKSSVFEENPVALANEKTLIQVGNQPSESNQLTAEPDQVREIIRSEIQKYLNV